MKDGPATLAPDEATALLVVDMQHGFAAGVPPTYHLVTRITEYVDSVGSRYALVAASRFRNRPGSMYQRIVGDEMQDDREVALLEPVASRAQLVVDADTYAKLPDPFLDELRGRGIERLHVCGIDTDQCVLATVFAAFDHDLEPIVLADLCLATSGDECHAAGLLALRRAIGDSRVVSSTQVAAAAAAGLTS